MLTYLIAGITLGFAAGISPGPLLVMVITETIKYDMRKGIKIALVPLVSDLPIVLFSLFIMYELSDSDLILALVSFLGALFLGYLAWENITIKSFATNSKAERIKGFWKGVLANFLSPHPYLFWMLVGAPIAIRAFHENVIYSVLFFLSFYIFIIGTKIILVFLTERSKRFLSSKTFIYSIKALGILLFILAVVLLKDGLEFIGLVKL
jgi:threonine/homoserine/homoserine lactone efflux protein